MSELGNVECWEATHPVFVFSRDELGYEEVLYLHHYVEVGLIGDHAGRQPLRQPHDEWEGVLSDL